MASKVTTGLVGLAVESNARQKLQVYYRRILEIVGTMPAQAEYRKKTEAVTNHRLDILNKYQDMKLVEEHMGGGQIEEVLVQAKNEHFLARNMAEWKSWEPIKSDAPSGQWDWP